MDVRISETKTIASEGVRGRQHNADGPTDMLLRLWSMCASLGSTDKMVFVSVMWTVPLDNGDEDFLQCWYLIIYCITMTKTISVTSMMITGFSAPPAVGGGSLYIFLISWWFVYFMFFFTVIFLAPLLCWCTNPSPSLFLLRLYASSSSFFAILQSFRKLSSENNSTKMFIKILKSISSYVYRCSLSLFIVAFRVLWAYPQEGEGVHAQSPSPAPRSF